MAIRPPLPILLVEDQERLALLVSQLLHRLGFPDTHVARTGEDALAMLRLHRYAVVISDLELGHMNGLRLLHAVRGRPEMARTPFILAETGFHHDEIRQALRLGVDGVLLKPYEPDLLRAKIAFALGERGRLRREGRYADVPYEENEMTEMLGAYARTSLVA